MIEAVRRNADGSFERRKFLWGERGAFFFFLSFMFTAFFFFQFFFLEINRLTQNDIMLTHLKVTEYVVCSYTPEPEKNILIEEEHASFSSLEKARKFANSKAFIDKLKKNNLGPMVQILYCNISGTYNYSEKVYPKKNLINR